MGPRHSAMHSAKDSSTLGVSGRRNAGVATATASKGELGDASLVHAILGDAGTMSMQRVDPAVSTTGSGHKSLAIPYESRLVAVGNIDSLFYRQASQYSALVICDTVWLLIGSTMQMHTCVCVIDQ